MKKYAIIATATIIILMTLLSACISKPSENDIANYYYDYSITEITPEVYYIELSPYSPSGDERGTQERLSDAIASWTIQLDTTNQKIVGISVLQFGIKPDIIGAYLTIRGK